MNQIIALWDKLTTHLTQSGEWIATLFIRLILGWEYYEAGIIKLNGENWFGSIQENFPFPFNTISVDVSWFLATWFEILGGIGLMLGLFTRFWSISLFVLTIVAILGVHWPTEWNSLSELAQGYVITDKGFGNFKLPLLFMIMFIPLIFQGAGKASVDHWLYRFFKNKQASG